MSGDRKKRCPLRPHGPLIGIFFLLWVFLWLGNYQLGGAFGYLYWFLNILITVDLGHLLLTRLFMRYFQDFSTDHPVKGEVLFYTLGLSYEGPFISAAVWAKTFRLTPSEGRVRRDRRLVLRGGETWKEEDVLRCSFRGAYEAGLQEVVAEDLLGLLQLAFPVWKKTFYVYPRVRTLPADKVPSVGRKGGASGRFAGDEEDPLGFLFLREYRRGEAIRRADWRRFSGQGVLFLREYEKTAQPGIVLLPDLRPLANSGAGEGREQERKLQLAGEDAVLEGTLALTDYALAQGIPLTLRLTPDWAYSWRGEESSGSDRRRAVIRNLLRTFLFLPFDQPGRGGLEGCSGDAGVPIVVSAAADPELLNLAESGVVFWMEEGLSSRDAVFLKEQCRERNLLGDRIIFLEGG